MQKHNYVGTKVNKEGAVIGAPGTGMEWIPLQPSKTPDQAGLPAPMEDPAGTGMYIEDT